MPETKEQVAKPTPGPRDVVGDIGGSPVLTIRSHAFGASDMMGDYRGLIVCSFNEAHGSREHAYPEAEANARLIAAAPDLLAACKALCRRLESNELVNRPDNPCNHYDQPAYDEALAAIAKAEGR
jgi:hypothetical protein